MTADDSIWYQTLSIVIEGSASPERASGLLKSAHVDHLDSSHIILSFPNSLMKAGADRSYIDFIKDALFSVTGNNMDVTTIVRQDLSMDDDDPEPVQIPKKQSPALSFVTPPVASSSPSSEEGEDDENRYTKKMTFDTFVRGDSNLMAYSAAVAVAEKPGERYNPLFIYGRSGLGKTHLLSAINNYVFNLYPDKSACYFQAKDLTKDLADATMKNDWILFDRKYASADIIMIDDIQFFQGKKESIERFFQILNDFIDKGRQVVISADRSPRQIDMDDRMISRFMKGLITDIQPPTFEMKFNIIKQFLKREIPDIPINDDVITYVAEISSSNIREIEGALHKLESYYSFCGRELDVENTKQILNGFFPDKNSRSITISLVQKEVERMYGISHEEMISGKRERRLNIPRQIAMYLCHELTTASYPYIGKKFGNRDHSTIMHGVSNIEKQMKNNRDLYDKIETLRQVIQEKA